MIPNPCVGVNTKIQTLQVNPSALFPLAEPRGTWLILQKLADFPQQCFEFRIIVIRIKVRIAPYPLTDECVPSLACISQAAVCFFLVSHQGVGTGTIVK